MKVVKKSVVVELNTHDVEFLKNVCEMASRCIGLLKVKRSEQETEELARIRDFINRVSEL